MEIGERPDRRRKPRDQETLERLAVRYRAGASIRLLALETGWGYGTVHSRLSMAQSRGLLKLRPRGGASADRQGL